MNTREILIANAIDDALAGMVDGNLEIVEVCGSVIAHQSRMLKIERDVASLEQIKPEPKETQLCS